MGNEPELDRVEAALAHLRQAISDTVRAEQLVDGLTKLANDVALEEWLQEKLGSGGDFWLAFIEVDHFKRINDVFTYQNADIFLKRIAEVLLGAARHHLPTGTVPFRAHGDEFYLAGELVDDFDPAAIAAALEHGRAGVALIRIPVRGGAGATGSTVIKGTVSVGWLTSQDSRKAPEELDSRSVRAHLELAVGVAKRTRDTVTRFDPTMRKSDEIDGRADCADCHTKFTFRTPVAAVRQSPLACPNCGTPVARPPVGQP
ncbi:MAG: diguanylate cyclase [Myxococcales bacterium]|nr:diguanylate cyclase [Myxococcales bacterium]